ncbi:uncharacterized protein LOC119387913 [Rhipicephalus sanguineus]|uniref:uncharacterized protein LOC119387913 n=1 Tax=Rhipicephalus sanguineus TaxID=34632 RepID=UPI0018949DBA|nr:uncharacterized protein LOC119387913 [Rhipicephalus sanguineus]
MAATYASMLKFCLLTAILIAGSRSEESDKEDASAHKYNIRLANGTSFEITTHGFQEFSKCLQRGATKGNNSVEIVKFNKCARDLYDRVQSNITDHLSIRDVGELGPALRNLSSLHRLNGNIVKNLDALQNSFQRLRLLPSGGASGIEPLQRTLQSASEAFRNMSKSVTSGADLQTVVHNFNRTLQTFNSIATAGVNAMTPTANQLVHRFQEDLKNTQNVTRSLPRTDVARLTEQTRGNLTLLVRNLTGALPVLMRRMATQGADSTRPLREFVTALSHNLRNASLALSNSGNASGNSTGSTLPTASHDLLQAYDGFQLAVNNGMLAMSDLVRGSLKLVNPANWHVGRVGLGAGDGQTPQAGINKFIGHLFRRRG